MKQIVFFDENIIQNFYPLCLTKPFSELRIGIFTFSERWLNLLKGSVFGYFTSKHLSPIYNIDERTNQTLLFIDPTVLPSETLTQQIIELKENQALFWMDKILAVHTTIDDFRKSSFQKIFSIEKPEFIENLCDLFLKNEEVLKLDFDSITNNRTSQTLSSTNFVIHQENIFVEEGAVVEYAFLNAKNGPIYIGKNTEIMEGSMIRGGLALCEGSKINLGTKIYGATTIGPYCKVGGEINNSIFLGYSNKAHDGFLGNSVIGEWCNLGADTNNSNLKNNYTSVKLYNYVEKKFLSTEKQFCGLFMGDHSKSAIGTRFNTGTVVGVCSNIFQSDFPKNYIPSFAWGNGGACSCPLEKALETAEIVMNRRGKSISNKDKTILANVFDLKI